MQEFFASTTGTIAMFAGALLMGVILILLWHLLTVRGKGILFALFFIFVAVPITARWAPGLWASTGIQGSNDAQEVFCKQFGGSFCKSQHAGGGYIKQEGGDPPGQAVMQLQAMQPLLQQGASQDPQTVTSLRKDALSIWFSTQTLMPSNWLTNASTAEIPQGVRCAGQKSKDGNNRDQRWQIGCVNTNPRLTLDPVLIEANGYYATDKRSLNLRKTGDTITGSGDWAQCTTCWDTVTLTSVPEASTPTQTSQQFQPQPTANPASGSTTERWVTVTDKSGGGAWTYAAVSTNGNLTCVGVNHDHDGVIPFGTRIQLVQEFPGAAWTAYLNSNNMGLTADGRCIFMGTVR